MEVKKIKWINLSGIESCSYTCGYCGNPLASEKGWTGHEENSPSKKVAIHICHLCTRPTFFEADGRQTPGPVFGNRVHGIPEESLEIIYDEARKAFQVGSYTASVLCCRKLLMHIAVSKGAKPKQSFVYYVEYLSSKHYVPPDATDWVDHIRKKSNEANHEIVIMKPTDAEELLSFIEMLLKVIYEFPATIKNKANGQPQTPENQ